MHNCLKPLKPLNPKFPGSFMLSATRLDEASVVLLFCRVFTGLVGFERARMWSYILYAPETLNPYRSLKRDPKMLEPGNASSGSPSTERRSVRKARVCAFVLRGLTKRSGFRVLQGFQKGLGFGVPFKVL